MHVKEISKDIYDVDGLIDEQFGKVGTPEKAEAEDKAFAFYSGTVIKESESRQN